MLIGFVCPHFPLTAPPEHFYRYYDQELPLPKLYERRHEPLHPYLEDYRKSFAYDEFFETPDMVKRAQAGYLGLCSFLDENIGKVLAALEAAGLADNTRVIYTSDHGDNLGARGLWGKSTMYEESLAVPLIVAGPELPASVRAATPVSLLDLYPFIMASVGAASPETVTLSHPGRCITNVLAAPQRDRVVPFLRRLFPSGTCNTNWKGSGPIIRKRTTTTTSSAKTKAIPKKRQVMVTSPAAWFRVVRTS